MHGAEKKKEPTHFIIMFLRVAVLTGLLATATAFAPIASRTASSRTVLHAEAEKTELLVDENFDEVNLVGLMGLNRLKKISRRHQRQLNDRIRNFEVVQDGEDYVPATAEQTEQMRAAAGAAAAAPVADTSSTVGKAIADPLKIIIAGAPASGKGTQCEIIKDKYGLVHLSTGDMLRAAVADQTEVGKLAKEFMDSGKLVPDDVIIGVVRADSAHSMSFLSLHVVGALGIIAEGLIYISLLFCVTILSPLPFPAYFCRGDETKGQGSSRPV